MDRLRRVRRAHRDTALTEEARNARYLAVTADAEPGADQMISHVGCAVRTGTPRQPRMPVTSGILRWQRAQSALGCILTRSLGAGGECAVGIKKPPPGPTPSRGEGGP